MISRTWNEINYQAHQIKSHKKAELEVINQKNLMNEIFDYGRPASIRLCVLVERKGHELPIQADYCGMSLELRPDQQVKLCGPDNLSLIIGDSKS